jgi:hypothetical protein
MMFFEIAGGGPAATRNAELQRAVREAADRARAAERAREAATAEKEQLRHAKVEAISRTDDAALKGVAERVRELDAEDHDALVDGTRLAQRRAQAAVTDWLGQNWAVLLREHLPTARAASDDLQAWLDAFEPLKQKYAQAEAVSTAIWNGAGQGDGRDVPGLSQGIVNLGSEIARLQELTIPAPVPRTTPATALIYEHGQEV